MAVTLHDIAKQAGVSVSTVSRVLNKKSVNSRISKQTEKLILKTAKELNYRPNQLARGLRLKRTHTIGLVVPDIANPFFAFIIKSVQTVSHKLGYTLVVCDTDENLPLEIEHSQMLLSKGVDGLIVLPVGQKFSHLEGLLRNGVPLVVVDRSFTGLNSSTVVIDNHAGAFEATELLIKNGHRRSAIIQGLPDTFTASGRLQGFLDAHAKYGIPVDRRLIVGRDFRKETGYIETKFLLSLEDRPTAIFTTGDLITLGALEAIMEEGVEVPRDVSIVAFDDIESASYFRCPITAVAQPKENMGEIAVKLLLEQIRNPNNFEPKRIVLKPKLIIRESVGYRSEPIKSGTVASGEIVAS
jgi:LacI family transcriptional regulator